AGAATTRIRSHDGGTRGAKCLRPTATRPSAYRPLSLTVAGSQPLYSVQSGRSGVRYWARCPPTLRVNGRPTLAGSRLSPRTLMRQKRVFSALGRWIGMQHASGLAWAAEGSELRPRRPRSVRAAAGHGACDAQSSLAWAEEPCPGPRQPIRGRGGSGRLARVRGQASVPG